MILCGERVDLMAINREEMTRPEIESEKGYTRVLIVAEKLALKQSQMD
jgi:hypothetical protein